MISTWHSRWHRFLKAQSTLSVQKLSANVTELESSTITEPSPTLCSPRCLLYLHNPRFQLLHRFWLLVLHSGTHHLLLHHAVLVQCSLVLVQYPLLVPFTQVLYGKRKQQVCSWSQEAANTQPGTSGTHTHCGHALCHFYAADLCYFVFKRVKNCQQLRI